MGTIFGALLGALFIQFVPNVVDHISKEAPSAVYALILIVSIYVMPAGAMGLIQLARNKLKRRGSEKS